MLFTKPLLSVNALLIGVLFSISCRAQALSTFTESKTPPVAVPAGQSYKFGYLEVPENRADPESRSIKLPVYIFKSRSQNPKPDPIIYTVGGPGSSSLNAARYMNYYQYLDDRDFILFEQRGTYYAEPALNCPEWKQASTSSAYGYEEASKDCFNRLTNQGIDLNGYRTTETAADMEDLRKLLDIEQWNLLTISYSTKIAQVMMRDYPESIRSVVMDSPLPLEVNYDEVSGKNIEEVLDRMFEDCESDIGCNNVYPSIKKRFYEYVTETNKNPVSVYSKSLKDSVSYTGNDLAIKLAALSKSELVSGFAMIEALLSGYESVLEDLPNDDTESDGSGLGMRLAVWCSEEFAFASRETIKKETETRPLLTGFNPVLYSEAICSPWMTKPVDSKENSPVISDIPTLIISGNYDFNTPLSWAQKQHQQNPNSHLLIFAGWQHTPTTNWGNPCAMSAANAFFNEPNERPKSECIEENQVVTFEID